MSRLVVGPFNRVEGDLEVRLDVEDGRVKRAEVVSPLYRGFEEMLRGKDARDGLVIAPRICGICSVSQSVAAAEALAAAQGLVPAPNGQLVTNIVHAVENIADHLTHFYLFFMPDFTRGVYCDMPWFEAVCERFIAMKGTATQEVLPPRAEFMHIVGLLAGKWPHTMALQPGGVTRVVSATEVQRLLAILAAFRRFLQRQVFGCELEEFSSLSSLDEMHRWVEEKPQGDLRHFLRISRSLGLNQLGRASDRFLSFGAYRLGKTHLFARGLHSGGGQERLNTGLITEDIANAWMQGTRPLHPYDGETVPDAEMLGGYTWCKAPRLEGQIAEVGALARQVNNGHPLALGMLQQNAGNVEARIVARFIEIALLVPAIEGWLQDIRLADPFIAHADIPDQAEGAGMVEAARGALGHWLRIKGGKIENYQIIAPTTWNFSPRDATGLAGPLETALENAPVREGEVDPIAVQHIVRSFDPCMVCTVH